MIPVSQAEKIIQAQVMSYGEEQMPILQAQGRILKEALQADRDFPPFDRVMMDGLAIAFSAWQAGQRTFRIQSTQLAGTPRHRLRDPQQAIEIMTGAPCPQGADTIIRVEDLEITEQGGVRQATILAEGIKPGQHLHPQGQDRKQGAVLLEAGRVLSSAEIAVAASIGKPDVLVSKLPKIALIATGDELVAPSETPQAHQIRSSNVYSLAAALAAYQIPASLFHLKDQKEELERGLANLVENYDILILSGGVSKGKADFIPEVMDALKVEKLFHRVKQRPGKPFWFGVKDQKRVFALPGNPVSTLVCFYRYVWPYLLCSLGATSPRSWSVRLGKAHRFEPDLTLFLPVSLEVKTSGELLGHPFPGHGSGDFANLLACDGFVELPAEKQAFEEGELYAFTPIRQL